MIMNEETQTKGQETQEKPQEITATQAEIPAGAEEPRAQSTLSLLDEARKVTQEMRKANEETRELLNRRENIVAQELLHGRALAGTLPTEKVLTPEEYAASLLDIHPTRPKFRR